MAVFYPQDQAEPGPAPEEPAAPPPAEARPRATRKSTSIPLNPNDQLPPEEAWEEYFSNHSPTAGEVADVVLKLQKARQTEALVACLEAALRNGFGQPWMYTVLALEMEQLGRPEAEVRRVLLSMIDSQSDPANLMLTAAFLTRYGAKDKALELYRQAAVSDPTRTEPFKMGIKLAGETGNVDGAIWAITGILQRAWDKGSEKLHQDALATTDALETRLRDAGETAEAERLAKAVRLARSRDLFVELTWNGRADLDLIVQEPGGTICWFDQPQTLGGGILAADGHGAVPADCLDRYVCPRGLPGEYRIFVRYNSGTVVGKRAVLRIVRYQGTPREVEDRQTIELTPEDQLVRVSLNQGRLNELGWVPLMRREERPQAAGGEARGQGRAERAARDRLNARNRRFAAGQAGYQPIITILPEGISNTVFGIVSADRRYVRLSMAPLFSAINDVFTFSFLSSGGGGTGGNPGGGGGGGGNTGGGLQ